MKHFLSTTFVLSLMGSTAALADCAPDSVPDGGVVTCTGTDSDGFSDGSDTLSVTVVSGASVSDGGDAIKIKGTGNTLVNDGTIDGGDEAVVGGDDFTLTNNGTIAAADKGVDTEGYSNLTLYNYGDILAADKGVRAGPDDDDLGGTGLSLLNALGARIISGDEGVESGDGAYVENHGLIEAAEDGVQIGENGTIVNHGTIRSTGSEGDGIDIDSGTITNSGNILSAAPTGAGIDVDAALYDLTVVNAGTISGFTGILVEDGSHDDANLMGQHLENSGLIEGLGGQAFYLAGGNDSLTMYRGGRLIGAGDFGTGEDLLTFGLDFFDDPIGAFAGGAVMDGGLGFDTVAFQDLLFGDISGVSMAGEVMRLSFFTGAMEAVLTLKSWESFAFADGTYSAREVAALAAVPLPAGVLLLGGALGALGAARRRKARR